MKILLALALSTISFSPLIDDISFTTKETGYPNMDYLVKQVSSTDTVATVQITGYATRSSAATTWMMCVYANMAMMRGKRFWAYVALQEGDIVLVGFPDTDSPDALVNLGPEFVDAYGIKVIGPTVKMLYLCMRHGYHIKYAPGSYDF